MAISSDRLKATLSDAAGINLLWWVLPHKVNRKTFIGDSLKTSPKSGPRVRTRGSQTSSSITGSSYEITPSTGVVYTTGPATYECGTQGGTWGVVYDILGPFKRSSNYREWKRTQPFSSSQLVVSPSSGTKTTNYIPYSNGKWGNRTWSGDGVGHVFGSLIGRKESPPDRVAYPLSVNVSNLQDLAVVGCLNRVNPARSQSLVTAVEAGKSVNMIRDRAAKLAKAYIAMKKGDLKLLQSMFPGKRTFSMPKQVVVWDEDGRPILNRKGQPIKRYARKPLKARDIDLLSDAARLELEFRYGWSPLVYDIVDSLKAINAQQLRDDLMKRDYTKVYERKTKSNRQSWNVTVPNFGHGNWTATVTCVTDVTCKAYATYTVNEESGLMNRLNDFGMFDIPRYLWEVTPLSFVADWLVPVGDWLGALSPKVGVNVIDSGVVTVVSQEVTRRLSGYTPVATGPGSWPECPFPIGATDSFQYTTKERSQGLPIPLIPPHEVKLNFKRLADALALLRVMR